MGSFEQTCGITNLPITWGDPVYVLRLHGPRQNRASYSCYPTDLYRPLCIPFEARYYDYGVVRDVDPDDIGALQLATLFNDDVNTVISRLLRNEYTWNEDHSSDHEWNNKHSAGLWMCHKDALKCCDLTTALFCNPVAKDEDGNRRYESVNFYEYYNLIRQSVLNQLVDIEDRVKKDDRDLSQIEPFSDSYNPYWYLDLHRVFENTEFDSNLHHDITAYLILSRNDPDQVNKILDQAGVAVELYHVLRTLRKSFAPQSGAGSQSIEYDTHKRFHTNVNKLIVQLKKAT